MPESPARGGVAAGGADDTFLPAPNAERRTRSASGRPAHEWSILCDRAWMIARGNTSKMPK